VEFVYGGQEYYNGKCGVKVEARTDVAYRYKNLVVRAEFLSMGDSLIAVDTFALAVYGDEGLRVGSTAGMLYQESSDISLPDISSRDSLIIRLYHLMPDEQLEGVHDIGVKLVNID
jgi:gliding motility-associated lipoprotein GldH